VRRLGLLLLLAACDQTAELGSRYAAQQRIGAADGGVVAAPAGDALAGASLLLPPGALSADALVTLEQGPAPLFIDPPPAGPVVMFAPVVALQRPALVTLSLRLMAGQSAADLIVVVSDGEGHLGKIDHSQLTIEGDRVRFTTSHLGLFGPAAVLRCLDVCPNGWTCRSQECHP
jgi:hypothetical protein